MIINSEDLKKYYGMINGFIDNYIEEYKISPKNLKKYLSDKNKFNNFVKRNNLEGIKNIEKVITDVLDDRVWMYNDLNKVSNKNKNSYMKKESLNIKKFGQYIKESTGGVKIFSSVGKPTIEHEKVLSDYLDVSLSSIEGANGEFSVNGEIYTVFLEGEIDKIRGEIMEHYVESILGKEISPDKFHFDLESEDGIYIPISEIVNEKLLKESLDEIVDIDFTIGVITEIYEDFNYYESRVVKGNLILRS